MGAVIEKKQQVLQQVDDNMLIDYLKSMNLNVNDDQAKKFITIAKIFGLNPFMREIYAISYGKSWNIIVGYEVYIKRAERSGKLKGWRVWSEGGVQNGDLKGCIDIKRSDWDDPFYHEVYFDEYNQNNSMWRTKPRTMIKKVAIAQGFRLAFSTELGGIPYTQEEIEVEVESEVVEKSGNISKVFAAYIVDVCGVPRQALKDFSAYAKSAGYDLQDDSVKEMLLQDKETLDKIAKGYIDSVMEAEVGR